MEEGRERERNRELRRRASCAFKIKREKGKQREVEKARAKERYGRHAWSRRRPVRKQTDCFAGSFVMRPWHINYFPTGSTPCLPHSPTMLLVFLCFTFFLRLLNDYRFEKHESKSMFFDSLYYFHFFATRDILRNGLKISRSSFPTNQSKSFLSFSFYFKIRYIF